MSVTFLVRLDHILGHLRWGFFLKTMNDPPWPWTVKTAARLCLPGQLGPKRVKLMLPMSAFSLMAAPTLALVHGNGNVYCWAQP